MFAQVNIDSNYNKGTDEIKIVASSYDCLITGYLICEHITKTWF